MVNETEKVFSLEFIELYKNDTSVIIDLENQHFEYASIRIDMNVTLFWQDIFLHKKIKKKKETQYTYYTFGQ